LKRGTRTFVVRQRSDKPCNLVINVTVKESWLYSFLGSVLFIDYSEIKDSYYWKNAEKEELDFVIKEDIKVKQLIQVCYDISEPDTKKREIRALLKASKDLKCKNLLLINQNYLGEEELEWFGIKRKVKFIPLWKWLLN